jgi:folate-binding protein YgfZ
VPRIPPSPLGFYSAFLTGQGRVLYDVFVYPTSHSKAYRDTLPTRTREKYGDDATGYLIDVDGSQVVELQKHLKKYKLRAKVDFRTFDEGELDVWTAWDEATEPWTPHRSRSSSAPDASATAGSAKELNDMISLIDSRAPGLGRRFVLAGQSSSSMPEPIAPLVAGSAVEAPESAYTIRRMLRGVPEGPSEIPNGAGLPAEHNLDITSAIDFRKGCYIGQELTIRTHHTGIVRKRILPVLLYPASGSPSAPASGSSASPLHGLTYDPTSSVAMPPSGADIKPHNRTGRSAGKFVAGIGNIGLGMCRVEMMTDLVLTSDGTSSFKPDDEFKLVWEQRAEADGAQAAESGTLIKAFVPEWMRGKIKIRSPPQRI